MSSDYEMNSFWFPSSQTAHKPGFQEQQQQAAVFRRQKSLANRGITRVSCLGGHLAYLDGQQKQMLAGHKKYRTQFLQEIEMQSLDRRSCEAYHSLSSHLFFK